MKSDDATSLSSSGSRVNARVLRMLSDVALASTSASTFHEALSNSVRLICVALRWPVGHAFFADDSQPNDVILRSSGIWYLESPEEHAALKLVTTDFAPSAKGMPLSPQWRDDVRKVETFSRQKKASVSLNVAAAFNLPIVSNGKLVAVAEFFNNRPEPMNPEIIEVSAMLGVHLARAFQQFQESTPKYVSEQGVASIVLAERMAALTEMAANVAHEINNPLTIIMGHIKIIRGRLEKGEHKDVALAASLDVVERTLGRVADFVKSMRHFCTDASNEPFEIISVNDVIAQALSLCSSKMSATGCDVVVKSSVDEDARIRSRGPQVCQAVVFLLQNAMDAVESLPAKWIELVVTAEGERVIIRCTDSGNGIAKDIRAHMMEPFFTTKDVGKGTGLGLSSAKGIIENHAGTLSYDEQSAHTTFIIELPRAV